MAEHRPAVGGYKILAVILFHGRGFGGGVNAPFVGKPAAIAHISAHKGYRCNQHDDKRIHGVSLFPSKIAQLALLL